MTAPARTRLVAVKPGLPLEVEDWVLALWVALASPAIVRVEGSGGMFGPAQPLDGLLWLIGVCGAAVCLVSRNPDQPSPTRQLATGITPMVAFGMFIVGLGAAGALGLPTIVGIAPTIAAAAWMVVPPAALVGLPVQLSTKPGQLFVISTAVRRTLITPYLLAAGSILYAILAPLFGSAAVAGGLWRTVSVWAPDALPALVIAGTTMVGVVAMVYAVFVYWPRQIVGGGGSGTVWLLRFGIFLVGLIFGMSWLSVVGV